MKLAVLQALYATFADWTGAQHLPLACTAGCSVCCSQNVTCSSLEIDLILEHLQYKKQESWLLERLRQPLQPERPRHTANGFVRAIMAGETIDASAACGQLACPLLDGGLCAIYPVRPLACRVFASTARCQPEGEAVIEERYLLASTLLAQLVEHLDQRRPWGNLLDLLLIRSCSMDHASQQMPISAERLTGARHALLRAEPLPGFLLDEQTGQQLAPFLHQVFATSVTGKTIEDWLNGR